VLFWNPAGLQFLRGSSVLADFSREGRTLTSSLALTLHADQADALALSGSVRQLRDLSPPPGNSTEWTTGLAYARALTPTLALGCRVEGAGIAGDSFRNRSAFVTAGLFY